jgi:hypothetical protein
VFIAGNLLPGGASDVARGGQPLFDSHADFWTVFAPTATKQRHPAGFDRDVFWPIDV